MVRKSDPLTSEWERFRTKTMNKSQNVLCTALYILLIQNTRIHLDIVAVLLSLIVLVLSTMFKGL
jgi:hypothetical protein